MTAPFHFGIVQAMRQPAIKPTTTDWQHFCKALERPRIRDQKDGLGAVFATFSKPWRNRENVLRVTAIGYDLEAKGDGPAVPDPAVVAEDLRGLGLAFAIWTTWSDRPEARRLRVVLPIDGGMDPALLRAAYLLPLRYLPIIPTEVVDRACAEPARMLILPACPPDRADRYECYTGGGDWLLGETLELLAREALQQEAAKRRATFRPGPLSGRESPIERFNSQHTPEEILEGFGYVRRGRKWISPNSHSGVAGVVVKDGKAFSHHSDAIGDHYWHDPFDLWARLAFNGDKSAAAKELARQRRI